MSRLNGHSHHGREPRFTMPDAPDLPPQNVEAERATIGSVLLDNDVFPEVRQVLPAPEFFYRDAHQQVWRVILDLGDAGDPIDPVTLETELVRRGTTADQVAEFLGEVFHATPHAANAVYYAQIVRQKAVGRELQQACRDTLADIGSDQHTAEDLVARAQERAFAVAAAGVRETGIRLGAACALGVERLTARRHNGASGLLTGFPEVDRMTDGFQPGQLIILAARPSMGKTAYALNVADYVSAIASVPAVFFSLEMGHLELAERFLIARSGVSGYKFKAPGTMTQLDREAVWEAARALGPAPLHLDDAPTRTMRQVSAEARRYRRRDGIRLVVIDYLQLLSPEGDRRENRQEQVAGISRGAKLLARDLEVPVLMLAQLNRNVESREDKTPRLSDLRESGAIEQDADIVLMLHRPEYYDPAEYPGKADVIIAKNRNGATGKVRMNFRKDTMRFSEDEIPETYDERDF